MIKKTYYTFLFFLLPLTYFLSAPFVHADLSVWMAMGKEFLHYKTLNPPEIFSLTPVTNTIYPCWLICLFYGFIWKMVPTIMAFHYLFLFHLLCIFFLLYLIYRFSLKKVPDRYEGKNLFIIFLSLYGISQLFVSRPALVALIPFYIFFYLLEKDGVWNLKKSFLLWGSVLFWAQIHASVLIIFPLVCWHYFWKFILQKRKWNLKFYSFLGTFIVAHITPYHFKIWPYTSLTAKLSRERFIGEWSFAFNSEHRMDLFFLFLLVVFTLFVFKITKEKKKFFSSPFILLVLMSFFSVRYSIFPFVTLTLIWFKYKKKEERPLLKEKKSFINLAIVIIFSIIFFILNPIKRPAFIEKIPLDGYRLNLEAQIPLKSFEKLKKEAPLFISQEIASGAELLLRSKVLYDSRNIVFFDSAYKDYLILHLPKHSEWKKTFEKYHFEGAIFLKGESEELSKKIIAELGWREFSLDLNYVLLLPSTSQDLLKTEQAE